MRSNVCYRLGQASNRLLTQAAGRGHPMAETVTYWTTMGGPLYCLGPNTRGNHGS